MSETVSFKEHVDSYFKDRKRNGKKVRAFPDRLVTVIEDKKYNVKAMSEVCGIPDSTLRDWIKSRRTPPEYIQTMVLELLISMNSRGTGGEKDGL